MHAMTATNLRSSYGGESMAHMRYTVWASKAEKDGLPVVARLFRAVAHSEHIHAWNHFVKLAAAPGEATVLAGAAFGNASTTENLEMAACGEAFEIDEMYPAYIAVAEMQGEEGAAHTMRHALEAEKVHQGLFRKAKASLDQGGDGGIGPLHVCDLCGAAIEGDAPDQCPLCGAPRDQLIAFV